MAALATCRCGQPLEMPPAGSEHVTCPRCEARVRIIRKRPAGSSSSGVGPVDDGFVRFSCPCGRRLKVSAADRPSHGKCPDCGRVVPVPAGAGGGVAAMDAETPTAEMAANDLAMLDAWAKGHTSRGNGPMSTAEMASNSPARKAEAGLRVCPRCGKPIHLGATSCRACGTSVPKR